MTKTPDDIIKALDRLGISHEEIAGVIGRDRTAATKLMGRKRSIKADEMPLLIALIERHERDRGEVEDPTARDYMPINVLPSYGGMGGGGTGEGDLETGLVPRRLVVDELRAKPADLLLIEARGESMMPDFLHGDQILIDRRDTNPVQPGSFALWDGDGYVIKLVERVPHRPGFYRIFSSNGRYSAYEVEAESIQIMGRPVWFARRL